MPRHVLLLLATCGLLLAGCASVHDDLSRQLLVPPGQWLVEPSDLGLHAEPFEVVLHDDASLTGFWIPNDDALGRTVVLLHEETVNASAVHPYYTFLHDAGFHVLVLDPRGYGKSQGTPTLRAWIHDLDAVFAWLRERPEVDRAKIALFGTSLGSLGAMWAARMHPECRAVVFEHLPSLRDMLREAVDDDGSAVSAYRIGALEFGLPENLEPADNAPFTTAPALFIATERESDRDRRSLLAAYGAYAGTKDLWIVPDTARAPHAMLTHDGEYQQRITAFLAAAFAGAPRRIDATGRQVRTASDGEAWYEIALDAADGAPQARWAAEACAVLPDGSPHFATTLVDGARGQVRLKLSAPPTWVAAQRLFTFEADAGAIVPTMTPLARAGAAVASLWPRIEEVRHGQATLAQCRELAADLQGTADGEPFHPRLEAELADIFALIGTALAAAEDEALRSEAPAWLQRAVDAAPEHPRLHFWPGPVPTYGFPQQAAVDRAQRVLEQLTTPR